ncbi:MAG: hypothetical protein AAFP87_08895 [Pseudomonadota bacterium]
MNQEQIFLMQFVLSMIVVAMIALWKLRPLVARLPFFEVMFWLSVPHALRHLGMVFLVPGVVHPDMPHSFAADAGYGDLASGVVALVALPALHYRWRIAIPLAWLFNVVGMVDLVNALGHVEAIPFMQSAWYIPTFVVPVLLVTHAMMLVLLVQRATSKHADLFQLDG